jgi:hypothetical protein
MLGWADRFPPKEADGWVALGSAWDRLGETDRASRHSTTRDSHPIQVRARMSGRSWPWRAPVESPKPVASWTTD